MKPSMIVRILCSIVVACATGLFLISHGGQAVAAPILVPLHIYFIRTGSFPARVLWLIVAVLLSMEAAYVYTLVFKGWMGAFVAGTAITLGVGGPITAALRPADMSSGVAERR